MPNISRHILHYLNLVRCLFYSFNFVDIQLFNQQNTSNYGIEQQ